jgi:protein TonB
MSDSMPSRLLPALTLSLALHLGLLLPDAMQLARPVAAPRIEASLRLPERAPPPASAEPLLKNTLTTRPAPPPVKPPPAAHIARPTPAPAQNRIAARREIEAAQRKLSQHLYYPPAAVARGIEGEVRLILRSPTTAASRRRASPPAVAMPSSTRPRSRPLTRWAVSTGRTHAS